MPAVSDIINAPRITEKATTSAESNVYVFEVNPESSKHNIADAVATKYGVKVKKVRTVRVKPKKKRRGRHTGTTNQLKKAYVTLAEGQEIDLFA